MAKVTLKNIYKVYKGGVKAVNDFNLDIPDKEFVVFVGPSGCGKSTTLRMIAGLEEITSGSLYIDDILANDLEPKDRDISMVFQNYALYPNMTVYENMAFGLQSQKLPKEEIKKKVDQAAEILGIKDYYNRQPRELSGGQRQRVALGRAIVREPKVFLLDEPLSNLDAKLRVQMRSEITKLHQRLQTTFIYVTHDQTEAMTMGTKIVVMKDGFIKQVDTPTNLYMHPANIFVATFLGSPQMNLFNAKIVKDGKKYKILLEEGTENVVPLTTNKLLEITDDNFVDKDLILGIRPRDIHIVPNTEDGFKIKVEIVEKLGDENLIYTHLFGKKEYTIFVVDAKQEVKVDDELTIKFDEHNIYLFDKENEESLFKIPEYNYFTIDDINKYLDIEELSKRYIKELNTNNEDLSVGFSPDKVSLEKIDNAQKIRVKLIHNSKYTNYYVNYALTENDEKIVFKTTDDLKELLNKDIDLFVKNENLELFITSSKSRITCVRDLDPNYQLAQYYFVRSNLYLSDLNLNSKKKYLRGKIVDIDYLNKDYLFARVKLFKEDKTYDIICHNDDKIYITQPVVLEAKKVEKH